MRQSTPKKTLERVLSKAGKCPEDRLTVYDLLPDLGRCFFPLGQQDLDTTGQQILTFQLSGTLPADVARR